MLRMHWTGSEGPQININEEENRFLGRSQFPRTELRPSLFSINSVQFRRKSDMVRSTSSPLMSTRDHCSSKGWWSGVFRSMACNHGHNVVTKRWLSMAIISPATGDKICDKLKICLHTLHLPVAGSTDEAEKNVGVLSASTGSWCWTQRSTHRESAMAWLWKFWSVGYGRRWCINEFAQGCIVYLHKSEKDFCKTHQAAVA